MESFTDAVALARSVRGQLGEVTEALAVGARNAAPAARLSVHTINAEAFHGEGKLADAARIGQFALAEYIWGNTSSSIEEQNCILRGATLGVLTLFEAMEHQASQDQGVSALDSPTA